MSGAGASARRGRVFLADFGLARDTATGSRLTRTGELLGTPSYLSPECVTGDSAAATAAADVWGLGCVLYECLTGRRAFDGESVGAIVGQVVSAQPPTVTRVAPGLPAAVDEVVGACLAKGAAARYPHARALRADLERMLAAEPLPRRRTRAGRIRWPVAVPVALAALAGVVAWWPRPAPTPRGEPDAAAVRAAALAARGWELRTTDAAQGAALLRQAIEQAPGYHAWHVQLGLLRWATGDIDGARADWAAIPAHVGERARADWLAGFQAYTSHLDALDAAESGRWRATALSDLARVPRTGAPEGRLAAAVEARLGRDDATAGRLVADLPGWEAALLRAVLANIAGRADESVREYTAASAEGLTFPWSLTSRAAARAACGDHEGALADLGAALARRPTHAPALQNRGRFRMDAGDLDGALEDLDAAVAAAPGYAMAIYNRAMLHQRRGELEAALRDFDAAVSRVPTNTDALYNRGRAHHARGDLAAAARDYDAVIDLAPGHAHAWGGRGAVRRDQGDLQAAAADLDRSIELDPSEPKSRRIRAEIRSKRGDRAGAFDDLAAAIAMAPDFAPAYLYRGRMYAMAGDAELALPDLATAIRLRPDDPYAYFDRGLLYQQRGELDRAMVDYEAALGCDPNFGRARVNRGVLLDRQGRAAEAEAEYTEAARRDPLLPEAHHCLGIARFGRGAYAEAGASVRRFLELAPNHRDAGAARELLAQCDARAGGR